MLETVGTEDDMVSDDLHPVDSEPEDQESEMREIHVLLMMMLMTYPIFSNDPI